MSEQWKLLVPEFLRDDRIPIMEWVKYKGEVCVADLDYEKSIKAHRPLINIHYCMTKAHNGTVIKTVNFKPEHFQKHTFYENTRRRNLTNSRQG
jgi:hypothetical protein